MSDIDSTRLQELLRYDPDTGVFTWRVKVSKKTVIGAVAGGLDPKGYVQIKLDWKNYRAHRLAWCYVYGSWPTHEVDHINGNRADNRISNLRHATHAQNMQNRQRPSKGRQFIGAYPANGRWFSKLSVQGKTLYLGRFDTPEEAQAAYVAAKRKHHNFNTL